MKIRANCPCCSDVIEIELNDLMEVISVEHIELESLEISSDESKELLEKMGYEFG